MMGKVQTKKRWSLLLILNHNFVIMLYYYVLLNYGYIIEIWISRFLLSLQLCQLYIFLYILVFHTFKLYNSY